MTSTSTPSPSTTRSTPSAAAVPRPPVAHDDRRLLVAGVAAGPLFVVSSTAQALTREGFDLRHHALSQLSTGGAGWVQMLTFVLTGLGLTALGVAVRRRRDLAGRRTIAVGVQVLGIGLAVAGLFPTDPANGFPVGSTDGGTSWHGAVHGTAAFVAFLGLAVATGAATVHAIRAHAVGPAVLHGLTTVVLLLPISPEHMSVQLALTGVVALTWTTALAVRLYRGATVRGGDAR